MRYLKLLLVVIIIAGCVVFGYHISKKNNIEENSENEVLVQPVPDVEIEENVVPDEEIPENIEKYEISHENKILCANILGEFENGQNLSTEEYLKVVYNGLNNGYINSSKDVYSKEEINSIVYSIFNVELKENKSIDGLSFENDKYKITRTDKQNKVLKVIEQGTAAGSIFIIFEQDNISYIAKIATNTLTGESYISSIIKE